jgi:hypothetical protein
VEVTLSAAFLLAAGTALVSVGLTVGRFAGRLVAFDRRLDAHEKFVAGELARHEAGIQASARHLGEAKADVKVLMALGARTERNDR